MSGWSWGARNVKRAPLTTLPGISGRVTREASASHLDGRANSQAGPIELCPDGTQLLLGVGPKVAVEHRKAPDRELR